jgi:hypothetical protein
VGWECFLHYRLGDIGGLSQQAMLVTNNTRGFAKVPGRSRLIFVKLGVSPRKIKAYCYTNNSILG